MYHITIVKANLKTYLRRPIKLYEKSAVDTNKLNTNFSDKYELLPIIPIIAILKRKM